MRGENDDPSRTTRAAFAICIAIAALIHLLPLAGVLGAGQLHALYGVAIDDPTLVVLLRHRALLFGLLGALLLASILRPALRTAALVGGIVSAASFLLIALDGDLAAPLRRVVIADVVALVALLVAAVIHARRQSNRAR